jgi:hypothetical protein
MYSQLWELLTHAAPKVDYIASCFFCVALMSAKLSLGNNQNNKSSQRDPRRPSINQRLRLALGTVVDGMSTITILTITTTHHP